ncbi:MAG: AAA family ATPase [Aeromicrobium sp.]
MTLTPRDYPYTPYPPFKEPEDWRDVAGGGATERDQHKARQWAADATLDHLVKHVHHDHPWCTDCYIRFLSADGQKAGLPELVKPPYPHQMFQEADINGQYEDMQVVKSIVDEEGNLDVDEPPEIVAHVPRETLFTWVDYFRKADRWETNHAEAQVTCLSSACRYLLLHGRRPADPWPIEVEQVEGEYLTRSQLDEMPLAEPLIEGILPRHSYAILRGRDGTLKTFVALDWALCLSTGQPWQGRSSEKVRTLYIAGEGAYGIAKRVDAWEAANGVLVGDEEFVVRKSALSLFKPSSAFDHMLDLIAEGGFGLVIVDTLRRVSGSADGNSSDMGIVVDNLDRIKRATADGSVLVLAHTGKDDHDSRGFSGIEDDADVVWHAKRDEMNLELECTKFKDGPDGHRIHLRAVVEGESLVLVEAGAEHMVASESQIKMLTTLCDVFPDGASGTQLLEVCGLPKPTFYRVLAALVKAGHVEKSGTKQRPFYSPVSHGSLTDESHESRQARAPRQAADQQSLTESHGVSLLPPSESHESHTPLGVRLETEASRNIQDKSV